MWQSCKCTMSVLGVLSLAPCYSGKIQTASTQSWSGSVSPRVSRALPPCKLMNKWMNGYERKFYICTDVSHTHTLSFTHNFVTHSLSHTTLSHTPFKSHTTLSHTHTIFHTQLCHKLSFTHNFVTHHLAHTHAQLCHTQLFHTQLCHTPSSTHTSLSHTLFRTQLCHTPSFTHNFVTHSLSHTHATHTHKLLCGHDDRAQGSRRRLLADQPTLQVRCSLARRRSSLLCCWGDPPT